MQYIVQYCKDAVVRAKNAAEEGDKVIRIGTSPMTPRQFLLDLWPSLHQHCPDIKFQLVPYENTPEKSYAIWDRTSTSWPVPTTKPCWIPANVPPWN